MSTVIDENYTIESEEFSINEDSIDDDKSIHIWPNNPLKPTTVAYCGSTAINHSCTYGETGRWDGHTECPGCGKPVCLFCLLILEGKKNDS